MRINDTEGTRHVASTAVRCTVFCLSLALVGSLPVSVRAGANGEAEEAEGALSVSTSPAGASVYVDGRLRGESPMDIGGLPTGDHRVKLVKDGYLENSRVLSVEADRTTSVEVTLTESTGAAPGAMQVRSGGTGGGGGGSILTNPVFLGVVAAGVGTGLYLGLRDTNKPPMAGTVGISPNLLGLAAATRFSFTANGASDPDGDSLTFSWDPGDGSAELRGQTVTHTYNSAGTYPVTLTVSDGKESASATGNVDVGDLTGTWQGGIGGGGCGLSAADFITMTLTQSGSSLSGSYSDTVNGQGTIAGTVGAPRDVQFTHSIPGFRDGTWSAEAEPDLGAIVGTVDWFSCGITSFAVIRN